LWVRLQYKFIAVDYRSGAQLKYSSTCLVSVKRHVNKVILLPAARGGKWLQWWLLINGVLWRVKIRRLTPLNTITNFIKRMELNYRLLKTSSSCMVDANWIQLKMDVWMQLTVLKTNSSVNDVVSMVTIAAVSTNCIHTQLTAVW